MHPVYRPSAVRRQLREGPTSGVFRLSEHHTNLDHDESIHIYCVSGGGDNKSMQSVGRDFEKNEFLLARIADLTAEKARIDAELAVRTAELRELFEQRVSVPSTSRIHRTNMADTTTATEIACLLRISDRSAHRLVQQSRLLVDHHPRTLEALRSGTITWGHTAALLHEYSGLPAGTAAQVEARLLPIALETTVPRLTYRARKFRSELHPIALDQRARLAANRRRVELEAADDAMAWLHIYLPATDASAIDARLTFEARGLQSPSERRPLSQLRTDVCGSSARRTPRRS
jgi:hypothetical protein